MASIKLTDLIDVSTLQEIQDGFSNVTGMAALTTDEDGNPVTRGSNFTDFCMKYTRKNPVGCQRCEQCDRKGGEQTKATGRAAAYVCHGGLMDFAAPIVVNGEFIGSFIGGQVLTEEPDENKFRSIAREMGINPEDYVRALRKVPIVPEQKVQAAADFLHTIAKNISSVAYTNYMMSRSHSDLENVAANATGIIGRIEQIAEKNIENISLMDEKFTALAKIADECEEQVTTALETVKKIQDIATNTRILGFNASIEASSAKENGKGFGVIAQEVRVLADTSQISADKIEENMASITRLVSKIDEDARNARELVDSSVRGMKELRRVIKELNKD